MLYPPPRRTPFPSSTLAFFPPYPLASLLHPLPLPSAYHLSRERKTYGLVLVSDPQKAQKCKWEGWGEYRPSLPCIFFPFSNISFLYSYLHIYIILLPPPIPFPFTHLKVLIPFDFPEGKRTPPESWLSHGVQQGSW